MSCDIHIPTSPNGLHFRNRNVTNYIVHYCIVCGFCYYEVYILSVHEVECCCSRAFALSAAHRNSAAMLRWDALVK